MKEHVKLPEIHISGIMDVTGLFLQLTTATNNLTNNIIHFTRAYRTLMLKKHYIRGANKRLKWFQREAKEALHNWDWLKVRW